MKNVLWASLSLVAAVLIFGCSSVSDSSNPDEMRSGSVQNSKQINALQGKRTDVPNWVYQGKKFVNGAYNCTIWVTDVAMSFTAPVYTCSTPTPICLYATWSPSGGSTSFVEFPPYTTDSSNQVYSLAAWGNYYIKAVDVYTANNGTVQTSNTRTIYTAGTADSSRIVSQAWCPAASGSGAGKIAFSVLTPTQSKICLVNASGGSATTIYTTNQSTKRFKANALTWSPDGTKLAFVEKDVASGTYCIKIIDLSGNVVATLLSGSTNLATCRWSNSGLNKIAYRSSSVSDATATMNDFDLYMVEADGSSSPQLIKTVVQSAPGWSPNNAEIAVKLPSYTARINTSTFAVTSTMGSMFDIDWK